MRDKLKKFIYFTMFFYNSYIDVFIEASIEETKYDTDPKYLGSIALCYF